MGKLRILTAGVEPSELSLSAGVNSLGRREENQLCVPDNSISGRHCEVFESEGLLTIQDLGSTNGSFIDGKRIEQGVVAPGQNFRLGNVELVYEVDPSAVPLAPLLKLGSRAAAPVIHVNVSPTPVVAAPSVSPPLSDLCSVHKSNVAAYVCPKCQPHACDQCAKNLGSTNNQRRFCPACSAKCVTLSEWKRMEGEKLAHETMNFRTRLSGVFKYPFREGGALLLIMGTILYLFLDFAAMFSWKLAILGGGYLCAYMQKIICSSAFGEEELPDWPEFGEWWVDIVRPFLMLIFTLSVSFAPALGYMIYHVSGDTEMHLAILFPLFALGFLYFPMALLAVAMSNSFFAVNPLVVFPAITKLNLEYVAATSVFFAFVLARYLCETLLRRFVSVPILPTLITGFLALYFLSAEMRLLGLMYYSNRKKLAWYRN